MPPSPARWFQSLKLKFTFLLLLGGLTAGAIGAWITYRATNAQLQQRVADRISTLAGAINHTAMATPGFSVVQHMIWEIVKDEPDIKNIVIAGKSPLTVLASSIPATIGLALTELPDEHLRRELLEALEKGHFGHHFESGHQSDHAGDLVVIVPPPNRE